MAPLKIIFWCLFWSNHLKLICSIYQFKSMQLQTDCNSVYLKLFLVVLGNSANNLKKKKKIRASLSKSYKANCNFPMHKLKRLHILSLPAALRDRDKGLDWGCLWRQGCSQRGCCAVGGISPHISSKLKQWHICSLSTWIFLCIINVAPRRWSCLQLVSKACADTALPPLLTKRLSDRDCTSRT